MTTTFNRFAKTTALASFMFIAFAVSAFAKPADVNKYLVKQFENQFRYASDVTWKTTAEFTSATFKMNDQKISVFYNASNDLMGISKTITVQDLPAAAQKTLAQKYADYAVVSVIDYTDAESVESYFIQLENNNKQTILQAEENGSLSTFKQ